MERAKRENVQCFIDKDSFKRIEEILKENIPPRLSTKHRPQRFLKLRSINGMFLAIPEYLPSIQTRTFLRRSARQVTMPHNLRLREELVKIDKQVLDSLVLLRSQGIARLALLIQPSLVADADRATVIGTGVGTDL